jgi:cytochrome c oxidase cbb3-type subunit 3
MRKAIVGLAACAAPLLAGSVAGQQQDQQQQPQQTQQSAQRQGPSAEQLLQVPVSGLNIAGARAAPEIRNPYADDPEAVEQGRRLFDAMNCSGCHAPFGGGGMGPPLSDDTWIYGGTPADVFLSIQQGRPNGMPHFGHMGDEAIWRLVSYVRSLNQEVEELAQSNGFDTGQPSEADAQASPAGAQAGDQGQGEQR